MAGIPGHPGHNGTPGRDGRDGAAGEKGEKGDAGMKKSPGPGEGGLCVWVCAQDVEYVIPVTKA